MALGLFAPIGLNTHLFICWRLPSARSQRRWPRPRPSPVAPRWLGNARRCRQKRYSFRELRRTNCRFYCVDSRGGHKCTVTVLGILLFGVGIGNATSLPPLIAQVEFPESRVPRVVALTVAVAQAAYACAAASFGLVGNSPHTHQVRPPPKLRVPSPPRHLYRDWQSAPFLLGRGPRKADV
jgi:hypothetical protein